MGDESVRTTVDIPADTYRRMKEQALSQGSSTRELILQGIETVLLPHQPSGPKRVHFSLICSSGPKVELTNEQIYEHVEFP